MVTLVIATVGWVVYALLARFTSRARRTFSILAGAVLALSIVPIFIEVATDQTRAALIVLHSVLLVAFIPVLRRH
jgi:hypothetical protein